MRFKIACVSISLISSAMLGVALADYGPDPNGGYQNTLYNGAGGQNEGAQNQSLMQWIASQTTQGEMIFNQVDNQHLRASAVNFLTEEDSSNSSRPSYSLFKFSSSSFGSTSPNSGWSSDADDSNSDESND